MKKLWILTLAAFTYILAATSPALAQLGEQWEWRNPLPQGNALNAIADGDGLFVAVGESGIALTSPDGESWEVSTAGDGDELLGIVYASGGPSL